MNIAPGQNKDDIEFTDIGAIEETRNKMREVDRARVVMERSRRVVRPPIEDMSMKTTSFTRSANNSMFFASKLVC